MGEGECEEIWIDAHKIVLIGESAGGFLVNYAGTHQTEQTQVAAVVDFYGPVDYGKLAQERQADPELFSMVSIKRHMENGGGIRFFAWKSWTKQAWRNCTPYYRFCCEQRHAAVLMHPRQ